MISNTVVIFLLFTGSIAFGSEPLHRIIFGQGAEWSVTIEADGSAMLLYGSIDKVQSPPGSFALKKVDARLKPEGIPNPSLEVGVKVYRTLTTDPLVQDFYYTENIEYLKELVKEVFEKSRISAGNVERFDRWLERTPPLGVQLYFQEDQIIRREDYTGPPLRLRRPPSWLARLNKQYALSDKIHPVALELLATPWPYLALLVLLGMVVRRYRLKKRGC